MAGLDGGRINIAACSLGKDLIRKEVLVISMTLKLSSFFLMSKLEWLLTRGGFVAIETRYMSPLFYQCGSNRWHSVPNLLLSVSPLGGASACIDIAKDYLASRKQFGKSLNSFQVCGTPGFSILLSRPAPSLSPLVCVMCASISSLCFSCLSHFVCNTDRLAHCRRQHLQFKFADMVTDLTASRLMIRNAASLLEAKDPSATLHCAMAKKFATDRCFDVSSFVIVFSPLCIFFLPCFFPPLAFMLFVFCLLAIFFLSSLKRTEKLSYVI